VNTNGQEELLREILLNPENVGLQKIYHDWLLDDERDCLEEKKLLCYFAYKHNNYFITELILDDIISFVNISKTLVKQLPITKISVRIEPNQHRSIVLGMELIRYTWPLKNILSMFPIPNALPKEIDNLLKNYILVDNVKIYDNINKAVGELENACLQWFRTVRDIILR
jgi:hypothetical protein